jgi:hypothetical protein
MLERSGMLAGLVRNRLAPCISDVFDACDTGPEVVRIDRLEIDLGTVAYDDLESALTGRLTQALQNTLHTRSTRTSTDAAVTARRFSARQNDLDLMAHFLSTGRLPWWAERRSQADVTRTMSNLIDKAHRELIACLRQQSAPDNPVLSRLVRQFEPGLVWRLIARLAPAAVQTIDHNLTALLVLHTARAILPLPSRELAWVMWEALLRRLLTHGSTDRLTDTIVAAALRKISASYQLRPSRLLRNLKTSNKQVGITAQSSDLEGAIGNLLRCMERDAAGQSTPQQFLAPHKAMKSPIPQKRTIGNPLTYLEPDDTGRKPPQTLPGSELVQKSQFPLECPMEKQSTYLERDGDNLPTPLSLASLERAQVPHFQWERSFKMPPSKRNLDGDGLPITLARFQPNVPAMPSRPARVSSRFRELVLTYLLEERTTRFSPEHCCACTIHRLAIHYDMSSTELLNRIRASIAGSAGIEEKTCQQFLAVLDSLHAHTGQSATPSPHDSNAPPLSQSGSPPNQLRHFLQNAPLFEEDLLHPVASDTCPALPTEDILAQLQGRLDRLGPKQVPARRRLMKQLPAARLIKPVEWLRQGDRMPETRNERGSPETTKIKLNRFQSTRFETDPSIYVQNAGMVLAVPFLPRLFSMLGLLEEKRLKNHSTAERAVHLLEFMVNERQAAPEFQLVLNKILCGLDGPAPIADGFDPTEQEIEAVHSMLEGMIDHWKIIGNTSVAGLRSSFLQRQGYLTLEHDAWHMQVEGRSFDMLLDQLPWSIAVIKHPWMTRVLHVNWR